MSDEFHFNDEDDAKAEIHAAVRYLLNGAAGSDRRDIVREIIEIVTEVARGLPPGGQDTLDDGMPGARRGTEAQGPAKFRRLPGVPNQLSASDPETEGLP